MYRPVLLILLMIRVWTGVAQEGVVRLSLDDALERFAACNLSLIAERYHVDMAEAQVTQAKLFENPVVSFEQNVYNRNNGKYFDLGKEGEAVVEIEQLIYIAGQRNKRVRLEKLNKEMAVYQFEEVIRTLRGELKEKFVDLYYTRKSLSVYDREIGYLSTVLDVYKEQNAKGNVSLLEKSRIQALLLSLNIRRVRFIIGYGSGTAFRRIGLGPHRAGEAAACRIECTHGRTSRPETGGGRHTGFGGGCAPAAVARFSRSEPERGL